jgi:vancomycin permeability regulator SanA
MARALALLIGSFALLNLIGGVCSPGFDSNGLWIDLRPLPDAVSNTLLFFSALCLLGFGFSSSPAEWQRNVTAGVLAVLFLGALWDILQFYRMQHVGLISPRVPLPLSLFFAIAFGFLIFAALKPQTRTTELNLRTVAAVFVAGIIAFPLAQMFFFGNTDYRRRADAIVVFGARTYADGTPSTALADRVRTASELYRDGYAHTLIFSGGPSDGAISEPEAMRNMALQTGVREQDILLDSQGLNTRATVANTHLLFEKLGLQRVLAVSHFYHLPRVKMECQRSSLTVFTVPAREQYFLTKMPLLMAREVVAFWSYFMTPFMPSTVRHKA